MTARVVATTPGEIEVLDEGSGAAVVLLHGLLVDETFWDGVAARLGPGVRVIRPALPLGAHRRALSADADLSLPAVAGLAAEVIRDLGAGPAVVVGCDTGTAVAQFLLTRHPDVVAAAVLLSGDAFEVFPPRIFTPLRLLARLPGGLHVIALTVRVRLLGRTPLAFGWLTRRGLSAAERRRWSGPLLRDAGVRRNAAAAVRALSPRYTLEVAEELRSCPVPVLLAWSDDDRAFPRSLADRLAAVLPSARVVTVPGAAAFSPLDAPDAVADLVLDHVRQHVPS